jgi:hypothetical protein
MRVLGLGSFFVIVNVCAQLLLGVNCNYSDVIGVGSIERYRPTKRTVTGDVASHIDITFEATQ